MRNRNEENNGRIDQLVKDHSFKLLTDAEELTISGGVSGTIAKGHWGCMGSTPTWVPSGSADTGGFVAFKGSSDTSYNGGSAPGYCSGSNTGTGG